MLTRITPDLPTQLPQTVRGGELAEQVTQLWVELAQQREQHRRLVEAITAWSYRLNQPGALDIAEAKITGDITGNASTVTTNANLTGHVTSVGNAAVLGSFTLAQLSTAVSDANVARTDAAQTFTGTQTFSGLIDATGGQIKFPNVQSASADANALDDYEEGTWTPSDGSGAGLSFSGVTARYTKVGRGYVLQASLTYPSTVDGSNANIASVPFTEANYSTGALNYGGTGGGVAAVANNLSVVFGAPGGVGITNANMSLATVRFSIPCMV